MGFGILSLALTGLMLYFAVIGIQVTVNKYRSTHGLEMFRDLLKYVVLFISVLFTCLGLSGLLGLLLDLENVDYGGKLDAARWLAFIVVGVPVASVMFRFIRNDFKQNREASNQLAWQIYLLAATTVSLLIWFIPLPRVLQWFAGEPYRRRELAQVIVAFLVWFAHLFLIRGHKSVVANVHRFAGLATGLVTTAVALINVLAFGLEKWIGVATGEYEWQNAVILLIVGSPVALFYWYNLDSSASDLEIRIYRTFAGKAVPTYFLAVAGIFALGSVLNWYFGGHIDDSALYFTHVPQQLATVLILAPMIMYFRHLVSHYSRDDISRYFQYLISGSALIGAGVAGGWFIAGLFEFNTFINTSISGFSGLMILLPIWQFEWRHCQHAIHTNFEVEHNSSIRRFFLYLMIGVPTISAFGFAVWFSYVLFKGLLVSEFQWIDIKAPTGSLVSALLIALFQYRVYRSERADYTRKRMTLATR